MDRNIAPVMAAPKENPTPIVLFVSFGDSAALAIKEGSAVENRRSLAKVFMVVLG